MSFFWQDVRNSLKETLMDYTVWAKWTYRLHIFNRTILYMWIVPGLMIFYGKIFDPQRLQIHLIKLTDSSVPIVWHWLLLTIVGLTIYEILSFLWNVIHKTGLRVNERWLLKHSK